MCAKKIKPSTLLNNVFSSGSVFNAHSQEYHTCVESRCAAPCLQAEECTRMHRGTLVNGGGRGAATDSGPPGQHIHSGPPAFRGGFGGFMAGDVEIAIAFPSPSIFPPSPKSDYTVSAIKIVQFCM